MRRFFCILTVLGLALSTALAVFSTGWGLTVSVEPTVASSRDFTVNQLSVYNSGAGVILVQVNTTTNDFTNAIVAGTTIPVPGGMSYTFNSESQTAIYNVFYRSSGATTNTVYLGGF